MAPQHRARDRADGRGCLTLARASRSLTPWERRPARCRGLAPRGALVREMNVSRNVHLESLHRGGSSCPVVDDKDVSIAGTSRLRRDMPGACSWQCVSGLISGWDRRPAKRARRPAPAQVFGNLRLRQLTSKHSRPGSAPIPGPWATEAASLLHLWCTKPCRTATPLDILPPPPGIQGLSRHLRRLASPPSSWT